MPFDSYYDVGAASVPAGGTAVAGTGTLWSGIALPGDTFEAAGLMARISGVGADDALTLVKGWAGPSLVDADYSITFNSPLRFEGSYVAEQARGLIKRLALLNSASPFYACLGVGTNAPPGAPAEGDTYVVGAAPSGAWVGHAGHLASWSGTAWSFAVPDVGWRADDVSADPPIAYVRGSTSWLLKSEASNLGDLQDVDLTGAADGDFLRRVGGAWVPLEAALADLYGVDLTGAAANKALVYSGALWLPVEVVPKAGVAGEATFSAPLGAEAAGPVMACLRATGTAARVLLLKGGDTDEANGASVRLNANGSLSLWAGGDYLTIDRQGRVQHPSQPRCSVYYTTTAVLGAGTLLFDGIRENVGNCYSAATGRFTAPVAGSYLVMAVCQHSNSSTSGGHADIRKNGADVKGGRMEFTFTASYEVSSASVIITLAANDYISVNNFNSTLYSDNCSMSVILIG